MTPRKLSESSGARCAYALVLCASLGSLLIGCSRTENPEADLLILNGNVYTLAWGEPGDDGSPAADAPKTSGMWKGDAEAVALGKGNILYVGDNRGAERYRGSGTRIIDAAGGTVLPGLTDTHVHLPELGATLAQVDLVGVGTEAEAIERVTERAKDVPVGEWIMGYGWDEGAWANRYPDMTALSEKVPDHPVYLKGLHGFAVWGNRLAFEKAGIGRTTTAPAGGEIRKDRAGSPSGILLNRAVALLQDAIPKPSKERLKENILSALTALASAGYVQVHEAGAATDTLEALESLEMEGRLPIRVYAMLSGRDSAQLKSWAARGPDQDEDSMFRTRSVKAYYDGALGSRGARLLSDYADRPGHRGSSGAEYGFDEKNIAEMMRSGFQVAVHAIGDEGNREALNFFEKLFFEHPEARNLRHRIEHAQVLTAEDIPRFRELGITASMQPPHAVEDMHWAEDRLGAERIRYAYAWRSLRRAGVDLVFNSDLPGSDYNIFYGLHAASTRRDKGLRPEGGWYPDQSLTPEEALRAYTTWAARTAFVEHRTGVLAPGRWADITILSLDPLALGERDPGSVLHGSVRMTICAGRIVHEAAP